MLAMWVLAEMTHVLIAAQMLRTTAMVVAVMDQVAVMFVRLMIMTLPMLLMVLWSWWPGGSNMIAMLRAMVVMAQVLVVMVSMGIRCEGCGGVPGGDDDWGLCSCRW